MKDVIDLEVGASKCKYFETGRQFSFESTFPPFNRRACDDMLSLPIFVLLISVKQALLIIATLNILNRMRHLSSFFASHI